MLAQVVASLRSRGTLLTLRGAVQVQVGRTVVRLKMCQFAPSVDPNGALTAKARQVRVRVMRQVHYSIEQVPDPSGEGTRRSRKSIDLVLFVNGLPVATVELKSDYTQSVRAAIKQYREDRHPGKGGKAEPLLQPGRGALVHFAVSNTEVHMTTRLAGTKTVFLPFNKGHEGGGGNPPNPNGIATSYLWEDVWQREAWLQLLGEFVFIPQKKPGIPVKGNTEPVLFPRYHQWDVVRRIITDSANPDGAAEALRFLIQHSAGSGKTNEVAWTSHALSRLVDPVTGQRVFSAVLVVTDRVVLDRQLQEAVRQLDDSNARVATITREEASTHGFGSKSAYLADVLESGSAAIAVTTLQTFPPALSKMKELTGKRFAIIVDEAHQSQDGTTAQQMTRGLATSPSVTGQPGTGPATGQPADAALDGHPENPEDPAAVIDEDTDLDADTLLERELAAMGPATNVTMIAFTATPRTSTLELFGTPQSGGGVAPYHSYPMKQAIEEGFILDVLRFYWAPKLNATVNMTHSADAAQQLVDAKKARRQVARRVFEDPKVIDEKARFILDHFDQNVRHLLNGQAKAMVVMSSRVAAARMQAALIRQARTKYGQPRRPRRTGRLLRRHHPRRPPSHRSPTQRPPERRPHPLAHR